MMRRLTFLIFGLILFGTVPALAADCPALVQQALAATDTLCHETGTNQACYGNINLKATANTYTSATNFSFNQPGDRVDISAIKSLQLSPMALDKGEWGVALMNVQASLPAAKPANLTLLAFGDVTLENTVAPPTAMDVNVKGSQSINVRLIPNLNSGVVGTVKPNQTVSAIERLADGSWLRVKLPDSDVMGWVKTDFITSTDDLNTLNIVDGTHPHYGPMQAFTFKSGNEKPNCAEVPQDGLMIQTPEGSGEVQLWINQVVVKLGSTVYFEAQAGGDMTITTIEGHATVEALGVTQTAVAGTRIHIKMDSDLNPIAAPTVSEAYTVDDVQQLPVNLLQRKITIHSPLTQDEIAALHRGQGNCPTCNGNNANCPGNSCHDLCPGNSCHNGSNNNNGNNGSGNGDGHGKP
jgi:hypothetical protein